MFVCCMCFCFLFFVSRDGQQLHRMDVDKIGGRQSHRPNNDCTMFHAAWCRHIFMCLWENLPKDLLFSSLSNYLHPRKKKTNMSPKNDFFNNRKYIFQQLTFRGHVSFQGSNNMW